MNETICYDWDEEFCFRIVDVITQKFAEDLLCVCEERRMKTPEVHRHACIGREFLWLEIIIAGNFSTLLRDVDSFSDGCKIAYFIERTYAAVYRAVLR